MADKSIYINLRKRGKQCNINTGYPIINTPFFVKRQKKSEKNSLN